jgi:hypothetical protein
MSARPRLSAEALAAALAGSAPEHLTREGRIRMLVEVADALMASRTEAGMFVGSGIKSWLQDGSGDLCRDHWKITGERGSHRTAGWVWQQIASSGGQQDVGEAASLTPSNNEDPKWKHG